MNRRWISLAAGVTLAATLTPARAHDVVADLRNAAPESAIAAPGEAAVGEPVRFDGSGSTDADGTVADWVWDFGDGAVATGPVVTHAWSQPGTYLVTLVVHDDSGAASESALQLVRVRGANGGPPFGVRPPQDLRVPLRDGTTLSARLFLPDAPGPFPVLMTHANDPAEGIGLGPWARAMVESGFAYLHVTARGQGTSGGLVTYTRQVGLDGYDIVEWAATQPWSNGRHAFLGGSNYGYRGWMAAQANPPHLTTAALAVTPQDVYRDVVWTGGILSVSGLAIVATLAHGVAATQGDPAGRAPNDAEVTKEMATHPVFDEFWARYRMDLENVRVPILYHVGWTDIFFPRQGFEFYRRALARTGGKLVVWPGAHGFDSPDPIDPTNLVNQRTLDRLWLEEKLAGIDHKTDAWPPVMAYRMEGGWLAAYREGPGGWVGRADWPVPGTAWTRYYLRQATPGRGGALSMQAPGPAEGPAVLVPAPQGAMDTRFANFYGKLATTQAAGRTGDNLWPRYDAAQNQELDDAGSLTFVTEPFATDVDVTGPLTLTVYVTPATTDVDLVAQVSDVWPDGHARFLANGMLRASMRALDDDATLRSGDDVVWAQYKFTKPEPLAPGQTYRLDIEIYPTSNLFRAGHRLRLDLAAVDAPMTTAAGAPVAVLLDAAHPSRLVVPVVPG